MDCLATRRCSVDIPRGLVAGGPPDGPAQMSSATDLGIVAALSAIGLVATVFVAVFVVLFVRDAREIERLLVELDIGPVGPGEGT